MGLISKIEGSSAYFYQYDGLGSTVAITDTTGAIKNKYAYDDFGRLATNSSEAIANPFKYVGKYGVQTDAPDLLYMRARYYMPSMGRFINKDPIGLAGGLNRYAYVGENPINLIDPSGLVTGGIGVTVNIPLGPITIYLSGGVVIDDDGNIGIYTTGGPLSSVGAHASGGISVSGSNADTICDLEGPFVQEGGGVGVGSNIGGDFFGGSDSDGDIVIGGGVTIGVGAGVSVSVGITTTTVTPLGDLW